MTFLFKFSCFNNIDKKQKKQKKNKKQKKKINNTCNKKYRKNYVI